MAGVGGGQGEGVGARCVDQIRFHAFGARCAVVDVEAVGIAEDQIGGAFAVQRDVEVQIAQGAAQARFHRAQRFAFQIRHLLAALQSIQLRGLRWPKALACHRVELRVRCLGRPVQAQATGKVGVGVVAIRRSAVQATAEAAGGAVVLGIAVEVAVVVVVAVAFGAGAGNQSELRQQRDAGIVERRNRGSRDVVVVVGACWARGHQEGRTLGWRVLAFRQATIETFQYRTCRPLPAAFALQHELYASAGLGVLLQWLAGQKVLQERHGGTAQVGRCRQPARILATGFQRPQPNA